MKEGRDGVAPLLIPSESFYGVFVGRFVAPFVLLAAFAESAFLTESALTESALRALSILAMESVAGTAAGADCRLAAGA